MKSDLPIDAESTRFLTARVSKEIKLIREMVFRSVKAFIGEKLIMNFFAKKVWKAIGTQSIAFFFFWLVVIFSLLRFFFRFRSLFGC